MTEINTATAEPEYAPVVGIFDTKHQDLWGFYEVTTKFTEKVFGGVPQKPEIIKAWVRQRIIGNDEEIRQETLRVLDDLGIDVRADMSQEEIDAVAEAYTKLNHGNTFRRDSNGLFLSDYQAKAAVKESVAILYPYSAKNKMGPTGKAARAFWAERVFVDQKKIHLMRDGKHITKPDGTQTQIGHVSGAQGQKSTLTNYDYVVQPECTFVFRSLEDMVGQEMWERVLVSAQWQGLGAIRSLSFGQFRVTGFRKLSAAK